MRRTLLYPFVLAGLSACTDGREPSAISSIAPVRPNRSILADTSSWNTYAFDVSTVVRRVDASGKARGVLDRAMTYRVERTLTGGKWKTVLELQPLSGNFSSSGAAQRAHGAVRRMVDDGDGTPPRFYDAAGTVIRVPTPARTGIRPDGAIEKPVPFTGPRPSPVQNRSAVNSFLLSPDGVPERRAALRRVFGDPDSVMTSGRNRYTVRRGGSVTVVVVDPVIAAPVEITEQRGGGVSLHVVLEYEKGADGISMLARTRTERAAFVKRPATVTETTYRNILLGRSH